jgi:hypothetical protein
MTSGAERTKIMQLDCPNEKQLVLNCSCGEKVVILGRVEDWLSRDPVFRCACGEVITFSDNAKDEYYASFTHPSERPKDHGH